MKYFLIVLGSNFVWGLGKQGYQCVVCKYAIHRKCKEKALQVSCGTRLRQPTQEEEELAQKLLKEGKLDDEDYKKHNWKYSIKNNSGQKCALCQNSFAFNSADVNKCINCFIKVHTSCLNSNNNNPGWTCSPPHKNLLLPFQGENAAVTPLIVFINPRSGGQMGGTLYRKFCKLLGKNQVFDLSDGGPSKGLKEYRNVSNLRILVAGGDGSVGWVLSELDKQNWESFPPVGVLPLGTGNDLARSLGFGGGYNGEPLLPLLKQLETAVPVKLDRWQVSFNHENKSEVKIMNNYFSMGSDAEVALGFHLKRESNPELFTSRAVNKMWYVYFGSKSTFKADIPLAEFVELEIDGAPTKLPKNLAGIIVLNLSSYAGGADLWGSISKADKKRAFVTPSFSDGMVEIVGIKSAFEMGLASSGLTQAKKIGQGKVLKLKCKKSIPVQVDGEPWMEEGPVELVISRLNQACMLNPQ